MQTKNLSLAMAACMLPIAAGLTGCDREAVSSPAVPALPSAQASAQVYELVTQRRPVSLEKYHAMGKESYEKCVALAQEKKLPVKPFLTIPPDFVAQRDTMKSDGVTFYGKTQSYEINVRSIEPEQGCATRIEEQVYIQRIGKGKMEYLGIGADGTRDLTSSDYMPQASSATDDLASYTVARIEKGIPLKCLPANAAALVRVGPGSEECVIDAGPGRTLRMAGGDVLVAYARVEGVEGMRIVMIDPVSLQLGKVDASFLTGPLR